MRRGIAGLIIGNEVLTAKVIERNGALLIQRARECGVELRAMMTVPDEVDAIVEALLMLRRRARWVITSGGVGPTHDDVTVRAVALSLGRKVVRLTGVEDMIRQYFGDKATPQAFRLADAPEGSELIPLENSRFPVLACDHIFMLPGVPSLFAKQLEAVLSRLPSQTLHGEALFLSLTEPFIAAALDDIATRWPSAAIGSYPNFEAALGFKVKVTVEHADAAAVEEVMTALLAQLPPEAILRRESLFPKP